MVARILLGLAILFGISLVFAYTALRPDMGLMRDQVPERLRGMYGWITRGWRGQAAGELRSPRRLAVLAPVTALLFALFMGLVAWDFIMSLEPHWFSTLFGPFVFMGGFLGALMTLAIMVVVLRSRLGLQQWMT